MDKLIGEIIYWVIVHREFAVRAFFFNRGSWICTYCTSVLEGMERLEGKL